MRLSDIFIMTKGTRVILAITLSVSTVAIIFAFFYYRTINRAADPRVKKAGEYLQLFDKVSGSKESIDSFYLLDSAAAVFSSLPDYRQSFENGVIYNNKCSSLLINAIYDTSISENEKNVLLSLSIKYCDSSIAVYKKWLADWEDLTPQEIERRIKPYMQPDDLAFKGFNYDRIISRRIKDIGLAGIETRRRLSVSLTNRGMIFRHMMMPDSSIKCYTEALELWEDNRIAKSNLNVLMGGEPVKPGIIESLFPPDRRKK